MNGNLSALINLLFIVSTVACLAVWLMDRMVWKQYKDTEYEKDGFVQISYDLLPVLLIVAIFRTYAVEPFNIPSESMEPILKTGDFLVVNKTSYGVKYPFTNTNMFRTNDPKKGEIAVFKYPLQANTYFIKRVIGGPGDTLIWKDEDFFINGKKVEREAAVGAKVPFSAGEYERYVWEKISGVDVLTRYERRSNFSSMEATSPYLQMSTGKALSEKNLNRFQIESPDLFKYYELKIPKDYYFVMGDNRDNSLDSRAWGLVHRDDFVGRASYLVMHLDPNTPMWKLWEKISFARNTPLN